MELILGHTFRLRIADTEFAVSSPALPLCQGDEPHYRHFRLPCGDGAAAVKVTVSPGSATGPGGAEKIFEAEDAYAVYREESDRVVAFRPGGEGRGLLWTARLSAVRGEVDVTCGPGMLRRAGSEEVLENPFRYPLDQIAFVHFLGEEGLLFHGAAAVVEGKAWLFAGRSGAGKTTLSRLLLDEGITVLSDDRVAVRMGGDGVRAWGTPWPGEAGAASPESAPLGGIFILRKGGENGLRSLSAAEASEALFPVLSLPWYDREFLDGPLAFCGELLASTAVQEFSFTPDRRAVETVKSQAGAVT